MKSETSDLEKFLTNKLESEIAAFGDGITEFHTRDLEALLELIENKNKEIERLKSQEPRWQPVDPNNLPKGEVLGTDGTRIVLGCLERFVGDSVVLENNDAGLYNCTHYFNTKNINNPTK